MGDAFEMDLPDFRDAGFLQSHIASIMDFYDPVCVDPGGGFFHFYRDDGSLYDTQTRHLVSSARFVFNYAQAGRFSNRADYKALAEHGLDYLRERHFNPQTGGYVWLLHGQDVVDDTNHCYGFAFVLLASAVALKAGITQAKATLEATFATMEKRFWDSEFELYRDEANWDFSVVSDYRGQNANMHTCEALLACYEATADVRYLQRARIVAWNITVRQAALADGVIWEHYTTDWQIDWDYNRDDPQHLFRPWGFQPGHQTEWCKLLLTLNRHQPEDWMVPTAKSLFDRALAAAWDEEHGGICYGFAPDASICDGDKYFWVQAESFAAAARLARATGDEQYWQWYDRIWAYSWRHMVDHRYGAWYRILTRNNQSYDDCKSPAGKTDYHTMGACLDVLESAS